MCNCHRHGPGPNGRCGHSDSHGPKKHGMSRASWRRFVSKGERRKALEKYRKELKKELQAVNERLEEL
ncbi:hypothetical protein AKJ50_01130 [candidate division MSBL1 archaeon SCGC-AAA382A13]|uniref:Uncharacterized protein n=1 Tax=candidate division MSBL1 archaeon SCGC-AAA382A13 TaxID=1698279 RepID=A0A133VFZ8_9EURY|nr:hypothetical protein AKJ50_01130 [candidate division MSBL1 archaeon SCGC-AAA382A13]